jgi:hypothetical protein
MNGFISNENSQFHSRIYHDPAVQLYALPYVTGHSKVQYSNWIRTALIRAVCYCPSVDDFNQERIRIELACFANGYSYRFVESRVEHFYNYFHSEALRCDLDQTIYKKWRQKWFDFITLQRTLLSKLQKRKDKGEVFRFHYLYEYGARSAFNKDFHHYPMLDNEPIVFMLSTKHLYSLNTLFAQH